MLLKLLKIDKLTHKKGYTVRLRHGVSLFYVGVYMKQNASLIIHFFDAIG